MIALCPSVCSQCLDFAVSGYTKVNIINSVQIIGNLCHMITISAKM